jgi:hypothetical protein
MTVTHQNMIHEGIKGRLNLGNDCYHSVQNLSSSPLVSKNIKIIIQKTIILPSFLCGFGTSSLKLGEEHRLRDLRTGYKRQYIWNKEG